jgi:hypothetical protein
VVGILGAIGLLAVRAFGLGMVLGLWVVLLAAGRLVVVLVVPAIVAGLVGRAAVPALLDGHAQHGSGS